MNYMKEVAQLLGVEIGEEFTVENCKYKFTEKNLIMLIPGGNNYRACNALCDLLSGDLTLTKIPQHILNETEKKYLSLVIRLFRSRIKYICKNNNEDGDTEFIDVQLDGKDFMAFPNFKKGTMYKGMETNREYSLEDLGL